MDLDLRDHSMTINLNIDLIIENHITTITTTKDII